VNSCLSLLGELFEIDTTTNEKKGKWIDVEKACQFILSCQNFDGGFGAIPGYFSIISFLELIFKLFQEENLMLVKFSHVLGH